MRKPFLFAFVLFLMCLIVAASDFIPQGDVNGMGIRGLKNITNISSSKYCTLNGSTCYTIEQLAAAGSDTFNTTTEMRTAINTTGTDSEYNINVLYLNGTALSGLTDENVCTYESTGDKLVCDKATTGSGSVVLDYAAVIDRPDIDRPTLALSNTTSNTYGRFYFNGNNYYLGLGTGTSSLTFVPVGAKTDTNICRFNSSSEALECNLATIGNTSVEFRQGVNGSYMNFSNVQIDDDLHVDLGWMNLTDYPGGCSLGYAVRVIGDTITCTELQNISNITDSTIRSSVNNTGSSPIYNISVEKLNGQLGSYYLDDTDTYNTSDDMIAVINISSFFQILIDWTNLQSIPDYIDNIWNHIYNETEVDNLLATQDATSELTNDAGFITNTTMNTSVSCSNVDGATSNLCTITDTTLTNFTDANVQSIINETSMNFTRVDVDGGSFYTNSTGSAYLCAGSLGNQNCIVVDPP